MLTKRALEIWKLPKTVYQPEEKQLDSYSLEDDVDLSGRDIIRFGYRNTEQPVDSWISMMEQVLKMLHSEDRAVLMHLAHSQNSDEELSGYVSANPADLRGALQIDEEIYVERNTSTNTKISMLRKFFKAYGQNLGELVFYLKDANKDISSDEVSPRQEMRKRYWTLALEKIKEAHSEDGSFKNVNPTKGYWINGSFGISGFSISCYVKTNSATVDVTLSKSDREKNKAAFDYLFAQKEEIEHKLGVQLDWWRFEGKASYISYHIDSVGLDDESSWTQMAKFHAEWSKKFYDVFVPLLRNWNQ